MEPDLQQQSASTAMQSAHTHAAIHMQGSAARCIKTFSHKLCHPEWGLCGMRTITLDRWIGANHAA